MKLLEDNNCSNGEIQFQDGSKEETYNTYLQKMKTEYKYVYQVNDDSSYEIIKGDEEEIKKFIERNDK